LKQNKNISHWVNESQPWHMNLAQPGQGYSRLGGPALLPPRNMFITCRFNVGPAFSATTEAKLYLLLPGGLQPRQP
jgi:hypothetical protein